MANLIESGSVSQLFATPIWSFKAKNGSAVTERIETRLLALRRADERPASDIWQSSPDLHADPAFEDLVALISEASRAVLSLMAYDCRLVITGLWGNISGSGEPLHEHTHPNNLLSGVFYVKVPDGAGETAFKDPRPQTRVLRPRVVKDTPMNSPEFRYRGSAGTLLLFPAWLEHGVTRTDTRAERITVAFNLMVHGPLGSRELFAYSGP